MHTDARTLENGSVIEGDLCIIGAGAAGIPMALEWNDTNQRVILLEGGGFNVEGDIQQLYESENVGDIYYALQAARLHYFGGTTGHWGGWCAPYDPIDFEKRDWVPLSGWPISRVDLDPFYARACEYVELEKDTFEIEPYLEEDPGRIRLPFDETVIRTKMWQYSPPTRFGNAYRDAIVEAQNIHLYTYANVVDIQANEAVSTVEQVTVGSLDGKRHTVRAKHFVLACGAIQNARMLLASNRQATAGLGNEHDLVGRHFMEHLEVDCALLALPRPAPLKLYTIDVYQTKAAGEVGLTATKQAELEVLNATSVLWPASEEKSRFTIADFPTEGAETVEMFQSMDRAVAAGQIPKMDHSRISQYTMKVRMEQPPDPTSRITLSDKHDALGVPTVKVDWHPGAMEKRSMRLLYETLAQEVGRIGLGRVQIEDWLLADDHSWPAHIGGGWHHMGTARMHEDPKQGVVDPNCRVHGLSNLFVAGSAAFPTGGTANPTLTVIALTLRLSDHLKGLVD